MKVSPASEINAIQGAGRETVGTIELRLYVDRGLDEKHSIGNIRTYYNMEEKTTDERNDVVNYKTIKPDSKMTFEGDCSVLEMGKLKKFKTAMDAKRPGKEPWAIFRFHYRSRGK
jgi:hypothetical protein